MAVVSEAKRRRITVTRYVVPHRTFFRFILTLGMVTFALATVVGVALWWQQHHFGASLANMGLVDNPALQRVLERQRQLVVTIGIVCTVSMAVCMVVVAAFLLHKVLGPIYRMERHLESVVAEGTVTPIRLRRTDRLHHLAALINQALSRVQDDRQDRGTSGP